MAKIAKDVFITHNFDETNRRRAQLVAGVLELINIPTITGENFDGRSISAGVQARIESARMVVALLTPDDDAQQPSQWTLQEVTWAVAQHIPCLLVVEEGVKFDGGIVGDLEQIRFAPENFASALVRIASQVQGMVSLGVNIPEHLPLHLSDPVQLLILNARENAKRRRWDEVLRLSEEALRLEPAAVEAALNKGAALMYLGQLTGAERHFHWMLNVFSGVEDSLMAKVHHNLGLIEELRDAGSLNTKSLRKQVKHFEKSLALNHKALDACAALILCRVALGELNDANALLMDSLKYRGFLKALHDLVETKGAVGHRLLSKLPDWLYSILFPTWDTDVDDAEQDYKVSALNEGTPEWRSI